MSELTITGTVIEILKPENGVSKVGKEWSKQDFVIETQSGTYKSKVAFTLFGDKTDLLTRVEVGMEVDVSFNVESREYNGKYFSNINAWKIQIKTSEQPKQQPKEQSTGLPQSDIGGTYNEGDDLPNEDLPF